MPPPDLSQQDSLALSQDKALAQSGIDPSQPSSASAFLEDDLGGYYHRLGNDQRREQQRDRAEMQLNADQKADSTGNGAKSAGGEKGGSSMAPSKQEEDGLR